MKLSPEMAANLQARVSRMEDALAKIAGGDFNERIPIGDDDDDVLSNVEVGINFMAQDLRDLFAANKAQEAKLLAQRQELEEGMKILAAKQQTIVALSTPVIRIWKDVLCLPLIGTFDTSRATEMTERVLEEVSRSNARGIILDITGIDLIDTSSAGHFIATAKAVRLLGCEALISGVSPAVAQTLVALGADFSDLETRRTLWDGLRYFLEKPTNDATSRAS